MAVPIPEVPGVEHRFVELDRVRLHVAEAGQGEPVVLLHGWPQHWWCWRHQVPELARDHRVICPDLTGLGWSDAPATGYRKDQLAADVLGALDAMGIDRFHLVGHDWGAFAGFMLCLDAPDRVRGYLALSIPHLWQSARPSLRQMRAVANLWYQVVLASPVAGERLVRQGTFPTGVLKGARHLGRWTDEELATYVDVLRQPGPARASVAYYRTFLLQELAPMATGRHRQRRLTVPTRLMLGAHDRVVRDTDTTGHEPYADDLRIEWVPDAGHFIPEEKPELVLERMRELLA